MSIYDQVVTNLVESIRSHPGISRSGKVVPPNDDQISKLIEYLQQLAGLYWFARRYEVLAVLFVLVVLVAYVASLVF